MNLKKLSSIIEKLLQQKRNSSMNISQEGLSLIKKFEGCELEAYKCAAGVLTIGYGSTKGVKEGDTITQEEADKLLLHEMEEYEGYINDMVTVDLEQNQFDAMVSWVFNLGPANLKASTLLKVLNAKDYEGVPAQIKRWNKAGGKVLQGLIRRREAESLLFAGKEWHEV
jgi:lysozyme